MDRRYYNCKLVTIASYPGPSKGLGYEAKSQGTGLEATCKHVKVEVNISLGKSVRDVTNCIFSGMNFNITEMPTESKGALRLIVSYPHLQVMWRLRISQE